MFDEQSQELLLTLKHLSNITVSTVGTILVEDVLGEIPAGGSVRIGRHGGIFGVKQVCRLVCRDVLWVGSFLKVSM